jgi:hypothetical protein
MEQTGAWLPRIGMEVLVRAMQMVSAENTGSPSL